MAAVLLKFQSKANTPRGSSKGIKPMKQRMVYGVVFHISLMSSTYLDYKKAGNGFEVLVVTTYARAVQLPVCCRLDHKILLTALGMIHANATQAPKKLNSRSVTVATATPTDTTVSARTCVASK